MTPEEKQLLLKDLCARLPYGVKARVRSNDIRTIRTIDAIAGVVSFAESDPASPWGIHIEHPRTFRQTIKPYLRPMSSMTEEEKEEIEVFVFNKWYQEDSCKIDKEGWIEILANYDVSGIDPCFCSDYVDWLLEHHFDFHNLIEKDLATDCTNLDIY